jgi:O-antigen/teichoic acid export membrane protein
VDGALISNAAIRVAHFTRSIGAQALAIRQRFRGSHVIRENTGNSFFGVMDYVIQGLAMLLAASFLVRRLGLSQYGLWMLATAIIGGMESLSSGFGDATIKFVSKYRGRGDRAGVERIIRATLAINGALGSLLATLVILGSTFAVTHIFKIDAQQHAMSIRMLHVAAITLLVRSIENVFSNTLRAYEQYGRTVKISIATRCLNVALAVLLANFGYSVLAIMSASLVIAVISLMLKIAAVRSVCGPISPFPRIDRDSIREIFGFGVFSWVQALAGVIFYNADRLVVGAILGTSALGIYSVCVQATQPIHGITSAALNFVFPHVSARHEAGESNALRRVFRIATWTNIAFVAILSAPLILFGRQILALWMGPVFAQQGHIVLAYLAVANACLGASVASHYILLALGQARFVASVNVLGGVLSLGCIALLMPHYGLPGAAMGRLLYAGAIALNFWKLHSLNQEFPPSITPTQIRASEN